MATRLRPIPRPMPTLDVHEQPPAPLIARARDDANASMLPQALWQTTDPDMRWTTGYYVGFDDRCRVNPEYQAVAVLIVLPNRYWDH